MQQFLLLGIGFLSLMACQSQQNTPNATTLSGELIFGEFYGRCRGSEECIEIFKLTAEGLYEDQRDVYPSSDALQVSFKPLSAGQHAKAKDLLGQLPRELLKLKQPTIGCPDCADQGGYLIAYRVSEDKGERQIWRVDKKLDQLPDYLQPFVQSIEKTIDAIQATK